MRVRFRRGSLKDGYHNQGWQQARKLPIVSMHGEAATKYDIFASQTIGADGMDEEPKSAMSIKLRASLVPAAAVIPAQLAYTDVVAVKTLVVRWERQSLVPLLGRRPTPGPRGAQRESSFSPSLRRAPGCSARAKGDALGDSRALLCKVRGLQGPAPSAGQVLSLPLCMQKLSNGSEFPKSVAL